MADRAVRDAAREILTRLEAAAILARLDTAMARSREAGRPVDALASGAAELGATDPRGRARLLRTERPGRKGSEAAWFGSLALIPRPGLSRRTRLG
jgi:hypothetical protein